MFKNIKKKNKNYNIITITIIIFQLIIIILLPFTNKYTWIAKFHLLLSDT